MKLRSFLFASAFAAACLSTVARADPFYYEIDDKLTTSDPTELGRASRSGTPQTWTHDESYTGQVNTGTTYYYTTYSVPLSQYEGPLYLNISVTDQTGAGDFFVSAFANSYDPSNRGNNWLGDMGSSGEYQFYNPPIPGDDIDFEVVLPAGDNLVLLVNSTLGGASGVGNQPYSIAINAFSDTQYSDPVLAPVSATPEPGSLMLTLTGVLGSLGVARRRLFARS
jgi:hypothetical protein